ncbi:MAG: type II toxin-antitoxin system VapC family toxin [Chloroflexi bacterium]|nr:type II toxin-antitoxin system VapC family toxin [Chloroflexota bacterium]
MNVTSPTSATIVVDASLAVSAVLPTTADGAAIERFTRWREEGLRLVAPMLWLAECVSATRRSVYAAAITADEGRAALEDLWNLEVEALPMTPQDCRAAFAWAERLGQARAYDGFYLALAESLSATLWTADERLANATRQVGAGWVHSAR